jgi:DEAD/DEAH box helicase domain-containing protein
LRLLRAYAPVEQVRQLSFDVLEAMHTLLGHRVKLDQLAKNTLGKSKSGDGIEAVGWWRAGEKDCVAAYCEQDVAILRDVAEHGRAKGHVVVASRQVTVKWE